MSTAKTSEFVCGFVAICAIILFILIIVQTINPNRGIFGTGKGASAKRVNTTNPHPLETTKSNMKQTKESENGTFIQAPPRVDNALTQDASRLAQDFTWDEQAISKSQLSQLALPSSDFKNKVRTNAGVLPMRDAMHNSTKFSKSIGMKSSLLSLHEMTSKNDIKRVPRSSNMPSWGLSEYYMSELDKTS